MNVNELTSIAGKTHLGVWGSQMGFCILPFLKQNKTKEEREREKEREKTKENCSHSMFMRVWIERKMMTGTLAKLNTMKRKA